MSERRRRSAALAYLLANPETPLHQALRLQGVDDAWALFEDRHPSIPSALHRRWESLAGQALFTPPADGDVHLLIPGDAHWPSQLAALAALEPWALWVRGARPELLLEPRSVAVVGARAATAYGERVAADLGHGLARAGVPVVSGGAVGIDAAAHRGALAGDGATIAVLACGVDVPYPAANAALFDAVAREGCIVSEVPPGLRPTRQGFLARNRIIAALAYGIVVVEARVRSGSHSTYRQAAACQRVLMAVPGPVTSPESAGPHELLKLDARLVTDADDVLALVLPLGDAHEVPAPDVRTEWDDLDARQRSVHELLPARGAVGIETLLAHTGLDIGALLAALSALADRGIVEETVDGAWRRRRRLRGAAA